jgi:hypothetical protein
MSAPEWQVLVMTQNQRSVEPKRRNTPNQHQIHSNSNTKYTRTSSLTYTEYTSANINPHLHPLAQRPSAQPLCNIPPALLHECKCECACECECECASAHAPLPLRDKAANLLRRRVRLALEGLESEKHSDAIMGICCHYRLLQRGSDIGLCATSASSIPWQCHHATGPLASRQNQCAPLASVDLLPEPV